MLPKYGERIVIASSIFVIFLSCLLLLQLGIESSLIMVIICTFIMGFGFGGSFPTLTIVIQASVNYNKRGAATALNSLVRTIGHTIGVSDSAAIFSPTKDHILTLITCTSPSDSKKRVVVTAQQINS
jgi:MFS family permease